MRVGRGTLVFVGVVLDRSTPESFSEFEAAVKADPRNPLYLYHQGLAAAKAGDTQAEIELGFGADPAPAVPGEAIVTLPFGICASASGSHSCAGQAKADKLPDEWKFVAKGTCEKLGGSTKAAGKK